MDREKCLVPSVVSLHVRPVEDNDPIKNIMNGSEQAMPRKLSYSLVRIYNTGYSKRRPHGHDQQLPPYLSGHTSHHHHQHHQPHPSPMNAAVINCRFNNLLRKTYQPLSQPSSSQEQSRSPYWPRSLRLSRPSNPSPPPPPAVVTSGSWKETYRDDPVQQLAASATTSQTEPSLPTVMPVIANDRRFFSTSDDDKSSASVSCDNNNSQSQSGTRHDVQIPEETVVVSSRPIGGKLLARIELTPQLPVATVSPGLIVDNVDPHPAPLLQPIKEKRRPNSSMAITTPSIGSDQRLSPSTSTVVTTALHRSKSSMSKSPVPPVRSASTRVADQHARPPSETFKSSYSPLFGRRHNTYQRSLVETKQSFPFVDPVSTDSSGDVFSSRLTELTGYVLETVKWERTRTVVKRPRPKVIQDITS